MLRLLCAMTLACGTAAAALAASAPLPKEVNRTYQDIRNTFGIVPSFVRAFPQNGIAAAWQEFKDLYLNSGTELDTKSKDAIMTAVDAQIPCRACSYLDREFSKLHGLTDGERGEAIAMAAITRHWSTYLNGNQQDEGGFRKETQQIFAFLRKRRITAESASAHPSGGAAGRAATVVPVETPDQAYQDIQKTLGSVPTFLQEFPKEGIAAAWKEMKELQLSPDTELTPKLKELIGLGVAAQIPCRYCVIFHTEAAKLNGASDNEIKQALAIAGLALHWSAVIQGAILEESAFRREVKQMVAYVGNARMLKPDQLGGTAAPDSGGSRFPQDQSQPVARARDAE